MNRYFNWGSNPLRFVSRDSARAEDVNAAFDQLSASMDTLDDDIDRSLKMPPGSPSQQILLTAMQRAGLTLGFDDLGNLTAFPGGGRARGDWAPGVAYVVGDSFREASTGNLYTVAISHTSTLLSADALVGRVRLTIDVYAVEQARASAQASAASAASFRSQASTSASNSATSASQASTSATSASNSAAAAASSAASISGGPVVSINGKTGIVTFSREDVGGYPSTVITSNTNAVPNHCYIIAVPGITLTLPGGYAKGQYLGLREAIGAGIYYINFNGHKLHGQTMGTQTVTASFDARDLAFEDSARGFLG